jgi:2'-hydroxyisoflavone reductase
MQRSQNGGEVFVPAAPDDPVQLVDARDVAGAVGLGLESGLSGTFNLVNHSTSWQRWLDTSAKSATQTGKSRHRSPSPTEFIWADDQEWVGSRIERIPEPRSADPLPMFLPVRYGWNFWRASNARALDAGVRFRPYEQTIRDTLEWRGEWTAELNAGLTGAQEKHLITAWRTRDQSG